MNRIISVLTSCCLIIVTTGCASTQNLNIYNKTDHVSIKVMPREDNNSILFSNEALYDDVGSGASYGAIGGAAGMSLLAMAFCGPAFLVCGAGAIAAGTAVGALAGSAVGGAVGGVTEWIADEDKEKLLLRFKDYFEANDMNNINDEFLNNLKSKTQHLFVVDDASLDKIISIVLYPSIDHVGDNKFSFVLKSLVKLTNKSIDEDLIPEEEQFYYVSAPIQLESWLEGDYEFYTREMNYAYSTLAERIKFRLSDTD